jgi:hypothetical protein
MKLIRRCRWERIRIYPVEWLSLAWLQTLRRYDLPRGIAFESQTIHHLVIDSMFRNGVRKLRNVQYCVWTFFRKKLGSRLKITFKAGADKNTLIAHPRRSAPTTAHRSAYNPLPLNHFHAAPLRFPLRTRSCHMLRARLRYQLKCHCGRFS